MTLERCLFNLQSGENITREGTINMSIDKIKYRGINTQSITISKATRHKLLEIRNNNNIRNHNGVIREMICVLFYSEEMAKKRDEMRQQLNDIKGVE